jgi:hypothetical protein
MSLHNSQSENGLPAPNTERTPLLNDVESLQGNETSSDSDQPQSTEVPLTDEKSPKELLLILSSVWIGCFLAALGND